MNYYEVLGLPTTATDDEIRKAFRKIASENHPDKNPGNNESINRFKLANEAFQTLTDEKKRNKYDSLFIKKKNKDEFESIFEDIFAQRDQHNKAYGQPNQNQFTHFGKGENIDVDLTISFKDSVYSCKKEVSIRSLNPSVKCTSCTNGGDPHSGVFSCMMCSGSGKTIKISDGIPKSVQCFHCKGTGNKHIVDCKKCKGIGKIHYENKIKISIPPGVETGQQLRVANQGSPGSPPGDLYVNIFVQSDSKYSKKKLDLYTSVDIPLKTAISGGNVELTTLDEKKLTIHVNPLRKSNDAVIARGHGIKSDLYEKSGDLHVQLNVIFPQVLSNRAKKLVQELEEEMI